MKKIKLILSTLIAVIFSLSWTSCNNDDDDRSPSAPAFPNDVTFHSIEIVDFKMWTDGSEVSTSGLTLENLIDPEDAEYLSVAYYEAQAPITFTADSISSLSLNGDIATYPYTLSNDSIFVAFPNPFNPEENLEILFGIGSPFDFKVVQGFSHFCATSPDFSFCSSALYPYFYSLSSALEEYNIPSLGEIGPSDTLIVLNQYVRFR